MGFPFKYIIRDIDVHDLTPNANIFDDYVINAPLTG